MKVGIENNCRIRLEPEIQLPKQISTLSGTKLNSKSEHKITMVFIIQNKKESRGNSWRYSKKI